MSAAHQQQQPMQQQSGNYLNSFNYSTVQPQPMNMSQPQFITNNNSTFYSRFC